jgi:hypothetical protein
LNFGVPDDGRQTEGRFEHGEVIADAGPRSATKRQELPAILAMRDRLPVINFLHWAKILGWQGLTTNRSMTSN